MSFTCSCPDYATMCKHVAAVLYGVGARLDDKPELLFALRGVSHEELIEADAQKAVTDATSRGKSKRLAKDELGEVFGIELEGECIPAQPAPDNKTVASKPLKKRRAARKSVAKKPKRAAKTKAGKALPANSASVIKSTIKKK
jgi:uncharacterized Zn finger protein